LGTNVEVSDSTFGLDNVGFAFQTLARWSQVAAGETRRARVRAPSNVPGPYWKFTLQRFPNNEHVGGGSDTSGNRWIRYLLTVKES